ncbi:MAG: twin-arginine translocase subunit TatC [Chloroflexi bacterium]|nr:twin-arginine translocase subunit TatC [Chloroflexota bacterium]
MKDRPTQLMSHFAELKKRLYISVAAILIATIVAFAFYRPIQDFVQRPAIDALESVRPDDPARLVQLDITEGWTVTAKVSVLVGFAAAFPVVLYQIVMFVRPGLKGSERRTLYLLLPGGTLLFVAGAAFAYYVAIPPAIHFLLQFGGEIALVTPRLSSYVTLVSTLMIWLGLIFEIPIAMFLLAKLGILRPQSLSKQRRWVILFAFVLAAVVTPTVDPVTQSLVAGPIIVLFELGLLLTRLATGKTEAENPTDRKVADTGG